MLIVMMMTTMMDDDEYVDGRSHPVIHHCLIVCTDCGASRDTSLYLHKMRHAQNTKVQYTPRELHVKYQMLCIAKKHHQSTSTTYYAKLSTSTKHQNHKKCVYLLLMLMRAKRGEGLLGALPCPILPSHQVSHKPSNARSMQGGGAIGNIGNVNFHLKVEKSCTVPSWGWGWARGTIGTQT